MKPFPTFPVAVAASLAALPLFQPELHRQHEEPSETPQNSSSLPVTPPHRLAWSDVNGDGKRDAFAIAHDGRGILFVQQSEGLVAADSTLGLDELPLLAGAGWSDVDSDGRPDLLLLTLEGRALLFGNGGETGFHDVTAAYGLELEGLHGLEWVDLDSNGSPDLVAHSSSGTTVYENHGGYFTAQRLELPGSVVGAVPGEVAVTSGVESLSTDLGEPIGSRATTTPTGPRLAAGSSLAPGGNREGLSMPPAPDFEVTPFGPICASGLQDQVSAACLNASSVPMLGMLYPLSDALNVNGANNRVGMGTTAPTAKLEVQPSGSEDAGHFIGTLGVGPLAAGPAFLPRVVLSTAASGAGQLKMHRSNGATTINFEAQDTATPGADLSIDASSGTRTVHLLSEEAAGNGAQLTLAKANGTVTMTFDAETSSAAALLMGMASGQSTVEILSEETAGTGAQIVLRQGDGTPGFLMDAEAGLAAQFEMFTSSGQSTVEIFAEEVAGDGSQIVLRKGDGTPSIVLDAEQGATGRITTEVLEITGGADLVETFDTGSSECLPGTVVVIDDTREGELGISTEAYDRRVAGVVSGAGGVRPGLTMGQEGIASGATPVALTGRVFVRCSSENGAIRPGDLLTTASLAGHAMRATDTERSFGAVIGKAMGSLGEGENGLVLVLVNLQ